MGIKFKSVSLLAGIAIAVGGVMAGTAGAAAPIDGTGTVHCNVIGTVKYVPALKVASSGPGTTTLKTKLTCTSGTGDGAHVLSGSSTTVTHHNTTDCATVLTGPPQPGTGSIKWKVAKGTAKLTPSVVTLTQTSSTQTPTVTVNSAGPVNSGSFHGHTANAHAVIQQSQSQILAACGGKGLKSLNIIAGSTFILT